MARRHQGPEDFAEAAFRVIMQAIGETPTESTAEKSRVAVESGRRGGLKGGKARAAKLTPERRSEIAKEGASIRWAKE